VSILPSFDQLNTNMDVLLVHFHINLSRNEYLIQCKQGKDLERFGPGGGIHRSGIIKHLEGI
jgi:hypothetical protein